MKSPVGDITLIADNEKRTLRVIILTGVTMIIEIVTGVLTGSMVV